MTMTQQYFDARGRPADETEALDHGILRDGYRLRTSMLALDSLQRAVAEFADRKRRRKATERDPQGRERGTWEEEDDEDEGRRRRKGDATGFTDSRGIVYADSRVADVQAVIDHMAGRDEMLRQQWRDGRQAAEQARREMIDALTSGRDAAPPAGAYPYSAAAKGTECTIDGQSGTLVKQGDWLVCKPRKDAQPRTDARTVSAADAQRVKDEAYSAMVAELGRGRDHG